MRKWVVIGFVVLVIGGGIAALVFRPRESSVEYHKRKYQAARDQLFGFDSSTPIEKLYRKIMNKPRRARTLGEAEIEILNKELTVTRKKLVALEYLVERRFALSNRTCAEIQIPLARSAGNQFPEQHRNVSWILLEATNSVVVTGLPEDMAIWEKLVREADAKE